MKGMFKAKGLRTGSLVIKGVLAATLATASIGAANATTTIQETGSSLLYPLFNLWVPAYSKAHPDVQINAASTGSGTGIAQSIAGNVQLGGSDAYLSGAMMKKHPHMLNIPVAISSQMVNYNLPGLNGKHIKLSGPVLSRIYEGTATYWDDSAIKRMNPGVDLPHHRIVPVHRSDGSGDTFLFTQYLSFSHPYWHKKYGYGTTVNWPAVQGEIGATGNPGMVQALKDNPYSVAYIGISYKGQIDKDGLGEAKLKNRSGNFVLPTVETVPAAAAAMVPKTPKDERVSLIFAPGHNAYPIINYEYTIVSADQGDMAAPLKQFLNWAVSTKGGNASEFLKPVNFMPLPQKAAELTRAQIAKIH